MGIWTHFLMIFFANKNAKGEKAVVYPRHHNFMATELEIKLMSVLLFLMQLIQVITKDSQKRALIPIFSFFTP